MTIHNQIILGLIARDKNLDTNLKNSLAKVQCRLSSSIPLVLEPTIEEAEGWIKEIKEERISLHNISGTCIRILKLHDGTFLVIRSGASAVHYDSNFSLIRELPFDYDEPTSMNTAYENVVDGMEVNFVDSSLGTPISTSLVALSMSTTHMVRLYKYANGVWSYFTTLGTGTSGHTTTLLASPSCSAMKVYTDSSNQQKLLILAACAGTNPVTTLSFIKKYVINMGGVLEGTPEVISYPGLNTTLSPGSLLRSETKLVTRMRIQDSKLVLINDDEAEFGVMSINENGTLTTLNMKRTSFKPLGNSDTLGLPFCFNLEGDEVFFADSLGHLAKTSITLDDASTVLGQFLALTDTTNYPFRYNVIQDILVVGNKVYFLMNNTLIKVNLKDVVDQEKILTLLPQGFDYKIEEVQGFIKNGEILVAVNDSNYRNLVDVLDSTVIKSTDFVYLKLKVSSGSLVKYGSELTKGIIVICPTEG